MKLYSTNNTNLRVSFKDAVFNSMPQDQGLYMPVHIPCLDADFIKNMAHYSFSQIAFHVADRLLAGLIPSNDLKRIIEDAINFDAPVLRVISKAAAETWSGNAVAPGTAGWARFKANGVDAGGASTTLPRIDMSIGVSSGDLRLATVALVSAAPVIIQSYTFTGVTP